MKKIADKPTILIDITNKCINSCSNCMRFCGHYQNPYFMDFEFFKNAIDSLDGWNGQIGIIGGEPLLHPDFAKMVQYLHDKFGTATNKMFTEPVCDVNKYAMDYMPYNHGKLRLYTTAETNNFYDNMELICDTFSSLRCNDHKNKTKHFSVLVNYKDLGISDEEFEKRENRCWIQNNCGASITPKGAFFCEMAGALDLLFDGPGGWDVKPDWWKRVDYSDQKHWCKICGARLGLPMLDDNQKFDYITESIKNKLPNSKKIKNGDYKIITKEDYEKNNQLWDEQKELQLKKVAEVSMSNDNKILFPKNFDKIQVDDTINLNNYKDWVVIEENEADCKKLMSKLNNSVLNPGNLYYYGNSFAINVNSNALKNVSIATHNIWGKYRLEKIINVKNDFSTNKNDFNVDMDSVLWKDVKKRNIINTILKHFD